MMTDEEKRLKKKYNKLLRKHESLKLALYEYAVINNDNNLLDLIKRKS